MTTFGTIALFFIIRIALPIVGLFALGELLLRRRTPTL
jgi:hypothetical protein